MVSARVDRVACLPLFYRVQMLAGSDLVFLFPAGADKKAEAGAGSATEFQFRGRFRHGRGQPPQ
jgi:hypothetical protein